MKVTGSYESMIRGVSEQVPHDRLPGQVWAQDNMISDPVRGLARRHGSVMVHELGVGGLNADQATMDDAAMFKEQSVVINGNEYSFVYRPDYKVPGSTMPGLIPIDKDAGKIIQMIVDPEDYRCVRVLDEGISSITTLGRYVLLAGKNEPTVYDSTDQVNGTGLATKATVWIKGGNYSQTFVVNVFNSAGVQWASASYTTMTSYYTGVLNTSDLNPSDPNYQKQVNDRVNAYNTAVNQHIAAASASIQPGNIATNLKNLLVTAGVTDAIVVGAHIHFTADAVTADDQNNGNYIKVVVTDVENAADLTQRHWAGKTVKISPRQNTKGLAYYVKAVPTVPNTTGWTEVIWEEAPGLLVTPQWLFLIGTFHNGQFYVCGDALRLEAVTGLEVPRFSPSSSGDGESSPVPTFFGGMISHLRQFQDRLMIVSGAVVYLSRSGDYFNLFRQSVLTLVNSDPIEVFAQGSEGDHVTDGVQIDRSLLLFGKRQQYAISGREALTPQNAYIAVQSAHEDGTTAPPVASGNLVFFCQQREDRLTLQQMQTGQYADTFEAFDVSTQLDGYLTGTPRQIVALTSPSMVFIRTSELRQGLYVYSYLDDIGKQERLFDSWSRWTWAEASGVCFGITPHNSAVYALSMRRPFEGLGATLVLDKFSRETQLAKAPYLDSRRNWTEGGIGEGTIQPGWVGEASTAVAMPDGQYKFVGRELATADELWETIGEGAKATAQLGLLYESSVEPTSPYMRDRKDRAILDARLTLGTLNITLANSAAMFASLRGYDAPVSDEVDVLDWVYRPAGAWVLNTQQVASTYTVLVGVMQEIREHRLRLHSRNWLPLTLSSIEWSGQFFTARRS